MKYYYLLNFLTFLTTWGIATNAQANIIAHRHHDSINIHAANGAIAAPVIASNYSSRMKMNNLELSIYQYINQYRQNHNLPPLAIDPIVAAEARAHSEEMSRTRNLDHNGFEQRTSSISQQIKNYGCAAENIAVSIGYQEPDLIAVRGWLESPQHHRTIIGKYNLTGIGVVQNSKGEYYFTQIFVRKR